MKTIHAIYENGIFRPVEKVDLPDNCEVEFEPRLVSTMQSSKHLEKVYSILNERYDSGEKDVAARHDEHQP